MKFSLRHFCTLGVAALLFFPFSAFAAELNIQSDTILRMFQRDTAADENAAVLPAYEYLQVDIENPDEPGLAFHLYGWGRADLADNEYFADQSSGELLYAYFEYTRQEAAFNARLGRQYVFEGVANEALDGLRLSSDLGRSFSGSLYAGQLVAMTKQNGRGGDSIFGGRLANHLAGVYDLGFSYKKIRNDSTDAEELAGLDLALYLPANIWVRGFSSYNLETDNFAEHSYELNASVGPVSVRPFYEFFQYEDYFGTSANSENPFRFLASTGEELTIFGADFTLPLDALVLTAKTKFYDYKVLDDKSQYYAVLATWAGEGQSQLGAEIGYMLGDVAQNDYVLTRLFSYWDQLAEAPLDFVSCEFVYVAYDQDIYGEDRSLFASIGTGQKFMDDALEVKISGDYSKDPYFDEDLRGMLTLSYQFGKSL